MIDLHTHTIYSDGNLTPSELIGKAKEVGLTALSLTDHDNVDGIKEALEEGQKLGIEVIPGIEFTSYDKLDRESHLLGYFIDYQNLKLKEILAIYKKNREKRAYQVAEKLSQIGYLLEVADIKKFCLGAIASPAIARGVIENPANRKKLIQDFGQIPSIAAFIPAFLTRGKPGYVRNTALEPQEVINYIHKFGGLAVLAHPCWNLVTEENGKLLFDRGKELKKLVEYGLDGLEVWAHRGTEKATRECVDYFSSVAKKYNLLMTGGSDYHGYPGLGKDLGFKDFYLKIPYEVLEKLKAKKSNYQTPMVNGQ